MAETSFNVKDRNGHDVKAKFLIYNGKKVPDPLDPKKYLTVPYDYDLKSADLFAAGLKGKNPFEIEWAMFLAFRHGGSQELQRTYNGKQDQPFVADFTNAASFQLGLIAERLHMKLDDIIKAGGDYNKWNKFWNTRINASGRFGNNPKNVTSIEAGYRFGFATSKILKSTDRHTDARPRHSDQSVPTHRPAPSRRAPHRSLTRVQPPASKQVEGKVLKPWEVPPVFQEEIPELDLRTPNDPPSNVEPRSPDRQPTFGPDDFLLDDENSENGLSGETERWTGGGQLAARVSDIHLCPLVTAAVPHEGGPVSEGSPDVYISGDPAARVGDTVTCVGATDAIVTGSETIYINGRPAARMTDHTAHGGVLVTGAAKVHFA